MRIGMTFFSFDGHWSGVEYYTMGLLGALLGGAGEHTYVLLTNQLERAARSLPRCGNLEVVEIKIRNRAERILWEQARLGRMGEELGLDVVHCPAYVCPAVRGRTAAVVTIHDTIALDHPEWCKAGTAWYYRVALGASAQRADRIVTVSECSARDVARHFPECESKVEAVYPGIDRVFRHRVSEWMRRAVQRKYGMPQRYLFYAGNHEPKKNLTGMLEAYRLLRRRGVRTPLVMAGEREWGMGRGFEKLCGEFAEGSVIRTGYMKREELAAAYQGAEAFVFCSKYEGFGFPALEAMASGTAVVASARGALRETLGGAARIADADSAESMADGIQEVIEDERYREDLKRRGMERSRRFRWGRAAREMIQVYERVRSIKSDSIQEEPHSLALGAFVKKLPALVAKDNITS